MKGQKGTRFPIRVITPVMPKHVAIIMDGNARWAARRGLPVMEGHREGAKTLVHVAKDARRLGIRYLTVFAFSTENWKRPKAEIEGLWLLLKEFCHKTYGALREEGIGLRTIGDLEKLPKDLQAVLASCEQNKPEKTALTLTLALSYGGRDEIVRAVRRLAKEGKDLKNLTEQELSAALDTADLPEPDLIIRTAGERRLSNFLPWEGTYSEIVTWPQMWPEAKGVLRAVGFRSHVLEAASAIFLSVHPSRQYH